MVDIAFPLSCWVALAVGSTELGNEIAGNGYVRQPAVFDYEADGVTGANTAAIAWCAAKGTWGPITICQIWDAATGGNLLGEVPTITPVPVALYEQLRIPPAGMQITVTRIPYGFGTGTWGVGRYNTKQWIDGAPSGIGSPYGVPAPYGLGPYGAMVAGVLLQKTFAPVALCAGRPGDWTPALLGCACT